MTPDRHRPPISGRLYAALFLLGAGLLVVLDLWGPTWSAPVVLIVLGLLSVVVPRSTTETEQVEGAARGRRSARRFGMLAVVAGVALLLRSLGTP
jgi:hypothetical protein